MSLLMNSPITTASGASGNSLSASRWYSSIVVMPHTPALIARTRVSGLRCLQQLREAERIRLLERDECAFGRGVAQEQHALLAGVLAQRHELPAQVDREMARRVDREREDPAVLVDRAVARIEHALLALARARVADACASRAPARPARSACRARARTPRSSTPRNTAVVRARGSMRLPAQPDHTPALCARPRVLRRQREQQVLDAGQRVHAPPTRRTTR